MGYKLDISEHADELLDNLIYYLLYRLKNEQAARHLLDEIGKIYDRLEENPFQFPLCLDDYLADRGRREAVVPQVGYVIIFSIEVEIVHVKGIFHQLEDYSGKT